MRSLVLIPALAISLGAGCCLESSVDTTGSSSAGTSSSGTSSGSTGGSSAAASTNSSSSSSGGGTTGTSGLFIGAIDAEVMTVASPETDAGTLTTTIVGFFLEASDWPACTSDTLPEVVAGCCFQAAGSLEGLNAGVVTVTVVTRDGGMASVAMPFQPDGGVYGSSSLPLIGGSPLDVVGGNLDGALLPAFEASGSGVQGPAPVLTPPLDQLTSLSTSQDWAVPLTASEWEYLFVDRAIIEADGVGRIICQTFDEGALMPALVVPASLLARFDGHQGTVTVTRDGYPQWVDAGAVLLGLRLGVGAQTEANGVSFTP